MQQNTDVSKFNKLIKNYSVNINELKEFLKLQQTYEKQEKLIRKNLNQIFLPLLISKIEEEIKKPPKDIAVDDIKKVHAKYIDEYRKINPENISADGRLKIKIDKQYFKGLSMRQVEKDNESLRHCLYHRDHIKKAVLFNLISYLEQSLATLLNLIFKKYPEILDLRDKSIKYSEISKLSSLEEAQDYLISAETDKYLYGPLAELFSLLENKIFNTDFLEEELKEKVLEVKERRNLIIHNNSQINSRYIKAVSETLQKKYKVKKDMKISLGVKYLKESIDHFEIIGTEIMLLAALKFQEGNHREEAAWLANSLIYDTAVNKNSNIDLGETLCKFILKEKLTKLLTDQQKDYIQLNYWLILKRQKKEFKSYAKNYDITSKNHIIQLSYYSLMDEYNKAYEHIVPSLNEKGFDLELYENFPILENLRKQKKSQEIIDDYKKNKQK